MLTETTTSIKNEILPQHIQTGSIPYRQKAPLHQSPIHIIIPVYNEAKAIVDVLFQLKTILIQNRFDSYRITIIDDCSSDNTMELIQLNPVPNYTLYHNHINLGKGYSLKKGFRQILDDEIVILLDGDGEHLPKDIPRLIYPIVSGQADMVIGSRFLKYPGSDDNDGSYLKNQKRFSHIRKMGNFFISALIFLTYGSFISDTQSGFRAIKGKYLRTYRPHYSRFEIETEMIIHALRQQIQIREVAIDSGLSSRESHMNILKDSLKIVLIIISNRTSGLFKKFIEFLHRIVTI